MCHEEKTYAVNMQFESLISRVKKHKMCSFLDPDFTLNLSKTVSHINLIFLLYHSHKKKFAQM